jgi:hypothetical protein
LQICDKGYYQNSSAILLELRWSYGAQNCEGAKRSIVPGRQCHR